MFPAATATTFQATVDERDERETTWRTVWANVTSRDCRGCLVRFLMLRLHYVPGDHGSPVCPKRSAPWDLDQFYLWIQVLLRLAKFFHGLPRYPWRAVGGRGCWVPEAPRRTSVRPAFYHGCQNVPSRPVTFWWVPHVSHVLVKVWHVFHVLSRLCTDETWTQGIFWARLCRRYKKKVSQAIAIMVFWDLALCQTVVERNAP